MSGVKLGDINRLKDRLVLIKFKEALVWNDEDLKEVIYSKSPSWFNLLKWLLEQLSGVSMLADPEAIISGIQKTTVGLGIYNSTQAANLISGKVTTEEKIKFLSRLISLVELMGCDEGCLENIKEYNTRRIDQILTSLPEVLGPLDDLNESRSPAEVKKRSMPQLLQEPRTVESYAEDNSLCQERVSKAKEKIERIREELGLEDDVTASDAIKQLSREREDLTDKIAVLVESLKPLAKEVKNIFETELKDLLPVDVADPVDLPDIDSLFEKVECILKVQNNEKALDNCITTLRNKTYNESPRENWSTKKSSSLHLFQLYEDSQHALMK